MSKTKLLLAVSAIIIGLTGLALWFFPRNVGTLTFSGTTDFQITLEGYKKLTCSKSPCSFKVKSGEYIATLSKEGFFEINKSVEINPFRESQYEIAFELIPQLSEISATEFEQKTAQQNYPLPDELKLSADFSDFLDATNIVYFDPDSEIIYWWKNGQNEAITRFVQSDFVKLSAADNRKLVLIRNQAGLYLLDLEKKTKQKVSAETFDQVTWAPHGSLAILCQGNSCQLFDAEVPNLTNLESGSPLTSAKWWDDDSLIFTDQEGFFKFNVRSQEVLLIKELTSAVKDFFVQPEMRIIYFQDEVSFWELAF